MSRAHPPVRLARNGALVLGLTVLVAWTGRAPEARAAEPTATGRTASGRPRLGAQLPSTLTIVTRRGGLVFRPLAAKPTGRKAARTPRHRRPSPALPRAGTGVRGRSDLVLTDLGEHYFIPLSDAVDLVRRAWHEAARQGGDEATRDAAFHAHLSLLLQRLARAARGGAGRLRQARRQPPLPPPSLVFLDTPALLKALPELPERLARALTIDHHGVFGASQPPGTNTLTQVLERIEGAPDAAARARLSAQLRFVSTDNVADALGTALFAVSHLRRIGRDARLRELLRGLAFAEDFLAFGPDLELRPGGAHERMASLFGAYDRALRGAPNDRIDGRSRLGQARLALLLQKQVQAVLLDQGSGASALRDALAEEFRAAVAAAAKVVEEARYAGFGLDDTLAFDADRLPTDSTGPFARWLAPSAVARRARSAPGLESTAPPPYTRELGIFTAQGDALGPRHGYILSNFFGVPAPALDGVLQALTVAEREKLARIIADPDTPPPHATILRGDLERLGDPATSFIFGRGSAGDKVYNFVGGRLTPAEILQVVGATLGVSRAAEGG